MNDYIVKGMVRMKREKIKKNEFVYNVDGNNKPIKPVEVTKTWLKGNFNWLNWLLDDTGIMFIMNHLPF